MRPATRRVLKTLPLEHPVPYAGAEGGELNTLEFMNPRFDTMRAFGGEDRDAGVAVDIVAAVTELPSELIATLDLEDGFLAAKIAGDLIEQKYSAAAARAAGLGITFGPEEAEAFLPRKSTKEPTLTGQDDAPTTADESGSDV